MEIAKTYNGLIGSWYFNENSIKNGVFIDKSLNDNNITNISGTFTGNSFSENNSAIYLSTYYQLSSLGDRLMDKINNTKKFTIVSRIKIYPLNEWDNSLIPIITIRLSNGEDLLFQGYQQYFIVIQRLEGGGDWDFSTQGGSKTVNEWGILAVTVDFNTSEFEFYWKGISVWKSTSFDLMYDKFKDSNQIFINSFSTTASPMDVEFTLLYDRILSADEIYKMVDVKI